MTTNSSVVGDNLNSSKINRSQFDSVLQAESPLEGERPPGRGYKPSFLNQGAGGHGA